jgi:predicted HTH transcriptional regulator
LDEAKLKQLLKKDENPKIDFKQSLSLNTDGEKKELTRDVLAIANSRGGRGYIVFGVEDKTKNILGIDPKSFNEEQIQQIIYSRCDPPVPISLDILKVQGKWLAVITIFKSHHKPHQMIQNGAFYLRRGSTTDVAKRYEIANLFQENGMMSYETVVFKNATLDHLNIEGIKKYFSKLGVFGENPNNVLLESMGFIGKGGMGEQFHPTIGGMLLFGRNLHMFLPHAFVKVICGEDVLLFCDNVVKVLDDVSNILEKKITEKDYPLDALKEALANAIVHRDYLDNSNGITVIINKKEISISNPGPLIAGNHLYRFAREKNPMRRNPWLYQRLMILDEKKRFLKLGSGITKIKKSFSKMGGVKFINLGEDNLFKVIFPRI